MSKQVKKSPMKAARQLIEVIKKKAKKKSAARKIRITEKKKKRKQKLLVLQGHMKDFIEGAFEPRTERVARKKQKRLARKRLKSIKG